MRRNMVLDTKDVYLLLGSNLADREGLIAEAIKRIGERVGDVFAMSSVYETAAWGKEDQPSFLNIALGVKTVSTPLEILNTVLDIEKEMGRVRDEKWGARLIDIDIILFDEQVIDIEDKLQVPHPQMQYRKFVLEPLAEIAADVVHPVLKKSVKEILESLKDNLSVSKI